MGSKRIGALGVFGGLALTTGLAVATVCPASANDKSVSLTAPGGSVHSVVSWDDSVDTLCLTLKSTAAGATSNADMTLGGRQVAHLEVSPSHRKSCTGNLSIAEDQLAKATIYGGTNTWWKSVSGSYYT
ncbi:hypothetical protein [Luteipulveratus mongoliensis]|uniref:Uncharacterized protein n=1 Tax=Luteipulveratus mongoliensis TaxID=571913 RepID=A0A0K1JDT3_9MICO|nr:hypothetical protein [Luteipulveratus mongoliensis]AKU14877.1 hypothetical protein VV02_01685 [Luteipulveratus mongoliensis]